MNAALPTGLIELTEAGFGNSIQDAGRVGFRHMGIAVSGYLDPWLARCANTLVGNTPDCACIEMHALGPTLSIRCGPVRLALAGDISATWIRADGRAHALSAWTSQTLAPGEQLKVASVRGGTACLAVSGGFALPPQLGSRSFYPRAMIGGIDGRPLAAGQFLPCAAVAPEGDEFHAAPWGYEEAPLRVMPGPQETHFHQESVEQFFASAYCVSTQTDRMGMRLEGAPLRHFCPEAADIVSDGVTPGAIQVPGNGLPIILLADCQTVGGYPKVATVIAADLPRLARLRPGQSLRFCPVTHAQARAALREREMQWAAWASTMRVVRAEEAMFCTEYSGFLVSADW